MEKADACRWLRHSHHLSCKLLPRFLWWLLDRLKRLLQWRRRVLPGQVRLLLLRLGMYWLLLLRPRLKILILQRV